MQIKINSTVIKLIQGDITKEKVDAVVNAANSSLMGGGGVDGAIHRAGGPFMLEECKKIVSDIGSLPTGEAVITTAGNMPSKYVIHTVGPVWHGGNNNEESLLKNAYYNSLRIGTENNITSIAFPSISTGIYGYPIASASNVAMNTVKEYVENNSNYNEVRFIVFSSHDFDVYKALF
jgi:O-acetyl-ADP-ribose deacetylase